MKKFIAFEGPLDLAQKLRQIEELTDDVRAELLDWLIVHNIPFTINDENLLYVDCRTIPQEFKEDTFQLMDTHQKTIEKYYKDLGVIYIPDINSNSAPELFWDIVGRIN